VKLLGTLISFGSITWRNDVDEKLGEEGLAAAIAGFLACQVFSLRFLVKEGVVDGDRLITFLESALEEMRPGIEDQRSLFALTRVIAALRTTASPLQ
jgi:hypothetical protein